MDLDRDVLQQIITSLHLFPSLPEIRFVQGHQDNDCPYATLSLHAQLNVDTDHLAGSYAPPPKWKPNNCNDDSMLSSFPPPVIRNYHHQI